MYAHIFKSLSRILVLAAAAFVPVLLSAQAAQVKPVTLACTVSPTAVFPGEPITVTATAGNLDPKDNAIYAFGIPGIRWSGDNATSNENTVTIDTTYLAPSTYYNAGASVKTGKKGKEGLEPGQVAFCTASFTVKEFDPPRQTQRPPQVQHHTRELCVSFSPDIYERPTRVDQEAKTQACLNQMALALKQLAGSKAVIIADSAQRAVNEKDYLVMDQGIDASRISVMTGKGDDPSVHELLFLVQAGANFSADVQGGTPVDESTVKPPPRKPLPVQHQEPRGD